MSSNGFMIYPITVLLLWFMCYLGLVDRPRPFTHCNERLEAGSATGPRETRIHCLIDCLGHADEDFFPNMRQLLILGCTSLWQVVRPRGHSLPCDLRLTWGRHHAGRELSWGHRDGYSLRSHLSTGPRKVVHHFVQRNSRKIFCQSILCEWQLSHRDTERMPLTWCTHWERDPLRFRWMSWIIDCLCYSVDLDLFLNL